MALPNQLKTARLSNATIGDQIDDQITLLETAICDIFGAPINTNVSQALFEIVAGGLKSAYLIDAAADPTIAGQIRYNGGNLKFFDGAAVWAIPKYVKKKIYIPAGAVNGTLASPVLDLPSADAPVAAAYGTSPNRFGVLEFANDVARTAQFGWHIPSDWHSALGVDLKFLFFSASTSTNDVVLTCRTKAIADGEDVIAPAFNAEQTVTKANNAVANTRNSASIPSLTLTGLAAGEYAIFRVGRDPVNVADTLAATIGLIGLELTYWATLA